MLAKVVIVMFIAASLMMQVTTAEDEEVSEYAGGKRFPECDNFCQTKFLSVKECCKNNQTANTDLPSGAWCMGSKSWCSWGKEAFICPFLILYLLLDFTFNR